MYYKLGKACVTNWGTFVLLQIRQTLLQIGAASLIKLGQVLLQIGAAITN